MDELQIGEALVARVVEFSAPVGLSTTDFFPGSDPALWQEASDWLVPEFVGPDGQVRTAVQTWVVRSEGKVVLIDTGLGNDKERPYVPVWSHYSSDFLGGLASLGIAPQDVDVVINTHLHLDHVGWNTRLNGREWVPTFPNATYLVHRIEHDFWDPQGPHTPGFGRGNQNAFEDSVAPLAAAGQLQLWEGDSHRLDGSLTLHLAEGHTPGSAVVALHSAQESALFAGDLLHSPLQVTQPHLASCFCEDPARAAASRERLLADAADRGCLILPAHFRGTGVARITRRDGRPAIDGWEPILTSSVAG
ncbi:MBL fold metallo-hydrolase [Dactylosporangium sp. NPDC049140]|uniref:MBL fold metallo-hydrolase n=1 Tax=Dactylosporangium sp. NPDC049140 TaxID=3155647 RepID=UPI0033D6900E